MTAHHGLTERLAEVVGIEHVLVDPSMTAPYGRDWTGRWTSSPLAVVRPATTRQVADVMHICTGAGVPVVPQGGNTGLVGGSVPTGDGSVVVATLRLADCGPVDAVRRQVTVGAGTSIARLHDIAAEHGLTYGVDLAARDSATIGGTVATNAGGVRVVHFGDTRAQVVGVEAVLASGEVMSHLGGLPKDSAGYDLAQLLVGSEGTLGVITAVRVQLRPALSDARVTTLLGVPSLTRGLELASDSVTEPQQLLALEYLDDTGMRLVCDTASLPHPLADRWPYYVLLETAVEPRLPVGVDAAVDRRLWTYRHRQPEAAASLGLIHSLDVALPPRAIDPLLGHLPDLVAPHRAFTFGHLAEGNLHIQVSGPGADDDTVTDRVLREVADAGGSISSEHGIGRAKVAYLEWCRDATYVATMRQVKHALDPHGVLNPGVLFTASSPPPATMQS